MNLEKINDIWLPKDLDTELQTNDMKVWFKYCKLQYKNFSHVIDMVGEYGIWARSMRLYAKKISSFQPTTSTYQHGLKIVKDIITYHIFKTHLT